MTFNLVRNQRTEQIRISPGSILRNMKRIFPLISVGLASIMAQSCEDSTTQAGSSLVEDEVEIVYDSSFSTTRSRQYIQGLSFSFSEGLTLKDMENSHPI